MLERVVRITGLHLIISSYPEILLTSLRNNSSILGRKTTKFHNELSVGAGLESSWRRRRGETGSHQDSEIVGQHVEY